MATSSLHISSTKLDDLKLLYANEINSVRTYERIRTFADLVRVLYDRDVLPFLIDDSVPLEAVTTTDLVINKELRKSELGKSLLPEFEHVTDIITPEWQKIAKDVDIEHFQCLANSSRDSAKILINKLVTRWGRISKKEFYFRLKNTAKAHRLDDVSSRISDFHKVQN